MITGLIGVLAATATGVASACLVARRVGPEDPAVRGLKRVEHPWRVLAEQRSAPWLVFVPRVQLGLGAAALALAGLAGSALPLLLVAIVVIVPQGWRQRLIEGRREALSRQLDGALVALAGALGTTPGIGEALKRLEEHLEAPLRQEIARVLDETRLGRALDDALRAMAGRIGLPAYDMAVTAIVVGRRTGGELPRLLARMAATLREMERLEGLVQSKTAEGRGQAWVMGLVPPALVGALSFIDPAWLAPLWSDPIGWLLVAGAAILEVVAVVLIRRILAVET